MDNFEAFDPSKLNWQRYCQQIKFYLTAKKIKEDLKLPTVLSLIGSKTFNLLCDLIAPDSPENKSVEEVFKILDGHFSPKLIARVERFKLRNRKQKPGESISDFVAALRKLSVHCGYKENLDIHLADQFIFGLSNQIIQKRLLAEEDDSTFAKLIQIATVAELTLKDAASLSNQSPNTEEIYKLQYKPRFANTNSCHHCGKQHLSSTCKFKQATCYYCKKQGHIISICRARKKEFNPSTPKQEYRKMPNKTPHALHTMDPTVDYNPENLILQSLAIKSIENRAVQPYFIEVRINNVPIKFEIDTGAAVSIIPKVLFDKLLGNLNIQETKIKLTALQSIITPVGKVIVNVATQNKCASNQELFIINECSTPLLGRTWIEALGILHYNANELSLAHMQLGPQPTIDLLLNKYEKLFSSELGLIRDFRAHIELKENITPKFCKYRPVPFALLPKIEAELHKLQQQNILEPIQYSDWAAPIVPILKKDNSLRICADYKVGLNNCIKVDQYPLPVIDDIITRLARGTIFTKLDLSQAYQQVLMDETSSQYLTINTHKGLFKVKRLPFGIASAPAIFQQLMDKILTGIPNTTCYLDDILVASPDKDTHINDLEKLLDKLEKSGIHLNRNKCEFFKPEVEYLGHVISSKGVQPAQQKIKAMLAAPEPQNVDQLRSLLGLISYYRKFLPNLATTLAPLNQLLCKNVKWNWDQKAQNAFTEIKKAITSHSVLIHYDPQLPIIVAADASPTGVGAILSHLNTDGEEQPIAFASRSLTATERNYSQLDREALAIIFAIKKFHQYIFGRKFTIFTDHKPLTHILHIDKQIPPLATARLQRWAIILSAYNYDIKFRPSKQNNNVDALSRLPCKNQECTTAELDQTSFLIDQVEEFPWTYKEIAKETSQDELLTQVSHYVKSGWPNKTVSAKLDPFFRKREEISIQDTCLLWGNRVIIPTKLQPTLLTELHRHHTGIVRMKMLARSLFWWPDLDKQIELTAQKCRSCELQAKDPPKTPLHPWIRPQAPWERIHVDFAGPIAGHTFLVLVDAFSKWPEVVSMSTTNTIQTALVLEGFFTRYGYPDQLVSDNGTQFTSESFSTYCRNRGIKHTFSPPYHPSSNGQAERFVQTFKTFLTKLDDLSNLTLKVNDLLFTYRTTPHTTTKRSPAELFLGRQIRNRLHLVKPPASTQRNTAYNPELRTKLRSFEVGDKVLSRVFNQNKLKKRWEEGVIHRKLGPVTYLVDFGNRRIGKRHTDQLRLSRLLDTPSPVPGPGDSLQQTPVLRQTLPRTSLGHRSNTMSSPSTASPRYPWRPRHPPDRYHTSF